MLEVSCRALGVLLKAAKRQQLDASTLTNGVDYDLAYLSNTKNRIGWETFARILRNSRAHWSLAQLSELNESFMRSPFFSYVGLISRLLFTSRDLFTWMQKRAVGGGAQLFSCVKPSYEHVGSDRTIIRLELPPPYTVSHEFFWMTRGAFIGMPRLVGAGDADVDMVIDERVATYRVRYRNKRGTLFSVVRLATWPFTARKVARELQTANEELQARFLEIEDAKSKLHRQATQLRTAHTINELVHRDLDVDTTLKVIAAALVDKAGFLFARIRTMNSRHQEQFGAPCRGDTLTRQLVTRGGEVLGEVDVESPIDAERCQREDLLAFLAPTLAMAVENAIYRAGLEHLVNARTAELQLARDELAATVVQLTEAQEARERFFGNISHEIRTPLTIIMLAVSDIEARSGQTLDERSKLRLSAIMDSSRKLVRLVDELLILAAAQEDKLRLHQEPTDLSSLIEQLGAAWQPSAEAAGVDLRASIAEGVVANVDPIAIERVVTNLVSNAVKYTPRGGTVEVQLALEDAGIRVSVLDTGPGISEELAGRLFGRYERSDGELRQKQGTGLGLALAKQLVNAHEGTISAHMRATGGSELRVLLPRESLIQQPRGVPAHHLRIVDPAALAPSRIEPQTYTPPGVSKGTVLLAEDDARLAEMVAKLLAEEYTVVVVHDGEQALDAVRRSQPHMLITDVALPGINGIELAKRFRDSTADQLAPVIILSAVVDLRSRLAGLEAGASDYVTKPFDPLELKARVRSQFRMLDLARRLHRAKQVSSLSVLTSGLAHELRNPANGIVNAMAPLRKRLPKELLEDGRPVAQLIGVIEDCASQIGFLSRQLLGLRNNGELERRTVAVRDLITRAVSLSQTALVGMDVRTQLAEGQLSCAPPLLTQVLTNLIENSAYAAGRGGWVEIRVELVDGRATIEVADSGPGVPQDLRDRIFEPFFTTKPAGVGTGLGLAVSREIVHRHGGVLEIRDRDAKPVFVIDIPNAAAQTAAKAV